MHWFGPCRSSRYATTSEVARRCSMRWKRLLGIPLKPERRSKYLLEPRRQLSKLPNWSLDPNFGSTRASLLAGETILGLQESEPAARSIVCRCTAELAPPTSPFYLQIQRTAISILLKARHLPAEVWCGAGALAYTQAERLSLFCGGHGQSWTTTTMPMVT